MAKTKHGQQAGRYGLRRGLGTWEVTFDGQRDSFRDEQGAGYVVWLLLHPPSKPIHAVALALEAGHFAGFTPGKADVIQQRNLGMDDAESVRNLRRQARQLEAVMKDDEESEPARAESTTACRSHMGQCPCARVQSKCSPQKELGSRVGRGGAP